MRRALALVGALTAALIAVGLAPAQTGDVHIDGNEHPNVGALLVARTDGSLDIACTGTLVSRRVFLTAGHCTDYLISLGQTTAYVTFDPKFGTDSAHNIFATPYHGTVHQNPNYKKPYQNDTGIVLLDAPVANIAPATIAPRHFLDHFSSKQLNGLVYTNVGYGTAEKVVVKSSGPDFPFDGIRKWTISGFHALNPQVIHLDQSLARGLSGTGYGDSGGPTFVDTPTGPVVISVVSSGDVPCYSTSTDQRLDSDDAQDFLAPYLALN
jgi:secreted trypsin-like serine protease